MPLFRKILPILGTILALMGRAVAINWTLPSDILRSPLYGSPDNNFTCRSSVHPNPIVLLHGISANRNLYINRLAWNLTNLQYCVFTPTYGAFSLVPWVGGIVNMRDSAKEIAAFITEVKQKTGADAIDLIGHSEGGVMALYVPMTQPGISSIINHIIALAPMVHGTGYLSITDFVYAGGSTARGIVAQLFKLVGCPACNDMATGGNIYNDFQNATRIVQPGNKASVILSNNDKLVAPSTSIVNEYGVRNLLVQDYCPYDEVGHAGIAWDPTVWNLVINELTEDYSRTFNCANGTAF